MNISFSGKMSMFGHTQLKSTQEKLKRQQKKEEQVAFWEKQKENLKNVKCDTVEDIARKLERFHTYEDEITAVKMAYNNEQMWHIMDEAKEMAEKIAKAAERTAPKTPEERKKEAVEEVLEELFGIETGGGLLDEILDTEVIEDMQEKTMEELEKELSEEMSDELIQDGVGEVSDSDLEEIMAEKHKEKE